MKKKKTQLKESIKYLEGALDDHKRRLKEIEQGEYESPYSGTCNCGCNSFSEENLRDPSNDMWSYRLTCTKCEKEIHALNAEECYTILNDVEKIVEVVLCETCGEKRFHGVSCVDCK